MGRTVKIGVIGCGNWGGNHARALVGLGALGAVCDTDRARAARLATETDSRVLTVDQMLDDPLIGGVVLALPAAFHPPVARRAIAAGKHVLVEKPMALDRATAAELAQLARTSGVVAMTGHVLRFHPAFERLEQMVAQRALGALRHVETQRIGLGRFFDGVDVVWDIAPHDLSLVLALMPAPPVRVHLESAAILTAGLADTAHLHLGFDGGVNAHCHVSRLSPGRRERRLTVLCDNGTLVFDDTEPWGRKLLVQHHIIRGAVGAEITVEAADPEFLPVAETAPLRAELAHFLDCIASGAHPRASFDEGVAVIEILDRMTVGTGAPPDLLAAHIPDRVLPIPGMPRVLAR